MVTNMVQTRGKHSEKSRVREREREREEEGGILVSGVGNGVSFFALTGGRQMLTRMH